MAFLARRLDRPELLAAAYPPARQAMREEVGITAILAAALGPHDTYVDVGTNRGQVLAEAVRIAPHGRHIAFEPIPALADQVRHRFPSVDCRSLAIGARREQTEFTHFRKLDGWSGLRRNSEISDERGDPELIDVQVSTLDHELA
ncbi:MAG TPA: FkbM family methyltransferase, partial [Solirubrobacteraceae bacterium]|nr:FkbM family methyltransferase [Solirubrobacteraceae bacterium]